MKNLENKIQKVRNELEQKSIELKELQAYARGLSDARDAADEPVIKHWHKTEVVVPFFSPSSVGGHCLQILLEPKLWEILSGQTLEVLVCKKDPIK